MCRGAAQRRCLGPAPQARGAHDRPATPPTRSAAAATAATAAGVDVCGRRAWGRHGSWGRQQDGRDGGWVGGSAQRWAGCVTLDAWLGSLRWVGVGRRPPQRPGGPRERLGRRVATGGCGAKGAGDPLQSLPWACGCKDAAAQRRGVPTRSLAVDVPVSVSHCTHPFFSHIDCLSHGTHGKHWHVHAKPDCVHWYYLRRGLVSFESVVLGGGRLEAADDDVDDANGAFVRTRSSHVVGLHPEPVCSLCLPC